MHILRGLIGILFLLGIAWLLSEKKRDVNWRFIGVGLVMQALLALLLWHLPIFQTLFLGLNRVVLALDEATKAGTSFVFGYLGGGDLPFDEPYPGAAFIFGFRALPLVLVISALSALLFHWGILQRLVTFLAACLKRLLGIGGAEALGVAANIFVGMVEAPLLIRPYVSKLRRHELFALMTSGMATIAGTVMVLYASLLSPVIPGVMAHILTASLLSAPASLVMARILIPRGSEEQQTTGELERTSPYDGAIDAIARGTAQGLDLLLSIIAMLIVLIALVYVVNLLLGCFPEMAGEALSLQRLLGWVMAPVMWMIGVPWSDCRQAGELMGIKTILNEMIAYMRMAELPEAALSSRSKIILTYAMCGFANPGSLGIMIAGLRSICPERSGEVTRLALRSVLAGTLAACLTGAIAGMMVAVS